MQTNRNSNVDGHFGADSMTIQQWDSYWRGVYVGLPKGNRQDVIRTFERTYAGSANVATSRPRIGRAAKRPRGRTNVVLTPEIRQIATKLLPLITSSPVSAKQLSLRVPSYAFPLVQGALKLLVSQGAIARAPGRRFRLAAVGTIARPRKATRRRTTGASATA